MSENGDSGSSRAANPANGRHFPGESSDSGNPTALFESVVGEKWFSSLAPAYNRAVINQRKIYGALGGAFHTRLSTVRGSRRWEERMRHSTVLSSKESADRRVHRE
jgi:hypothetical protein